MAGPSRLKLVGLVEGMCPNVLGQEFFRSVNCEPWGYVALVRHIYLIIIITCCFGGSMSSYRVNYHIIIVIIIIINVIIINNDYYYYYNLRYWR